LQPLSRQSKVVLRKLCQDLSLNGVASVLSQTSNNINININIPQSCWWYMQIEVDECLG